MIRCSKRTVVLTFTILIGTIAHWAGPVSGATLPANGETQWRQIGIINPPSHCADAMSVISVWTVRYIDFGNHRFCIYDHPAVGPFQEFSNALATPTTVTWIHPPEPDAMIVQPMSSPGLSDAVWKSFSKRFDHGAGKVALPLILDRPEVRFSLIDTSPTSALVENSPHGRSLGFFAEHFLCDGSQRCLFTGVPHLALGYLYHDNPLPSGWDSDSGGHVGLLSSLALAILSATESWELSDSPNLVINLSVAWDDSLSEPLTPVPEDASSGQAASSTSSLSAPEKLVYAAIRDAVCSGALVIAAAGNRFDNVGNKGPLLPAAWESVSVPTSCLTPGSAYQPLVYGVGAVNADGRTSLTARPDGLPPLVAYGEAAVTPGESQFEPTATLTGSSVSSLVTSMAAIAVWYYFPDLRAAEVMDLIYASSPVKETGGTSVPDFCLSDPTTYPCSVARSKIHQVDICSSVMGACTDSSLGGCPHPLSEASGKACPGGASPWDPPLFDPIPPTPISVSSLPVSPPPSQCLDPGDWYQTDPANPAFFCPSWVLPGFGATPWVNPQPNSDPCPNCYLDKGNGGSGSGSGGGLFVEIDPGFNGVVTSMTLSQCGVHTALNGPLPSIQPGVPVQIQNLPLIQCPTAELSFAVDTGFSTQSTLSPVAVVP